MKRYLLALSLVGLTSCATEQYEYSALRQITKIEVQGKPADTPPFRSKVTYITDKPQVARIVALFNAQRSNWRDAEVVAPSPMPDTFVTFHAGATKQDTVGVSSSFMTKFGTPQGNVIKNISSKESEEIYDALKSAK